MGASQDDDLARARAETRAAFENRALMYWHIFRELAEEIGPGRSAEVMKRAIRARGQELAGRYRAAAEAGDLEEVARIFCESSPCGGALFEPGVEAREADTLVLRMTACPLVDAWRAAGLGADTVDLMCEIAAAVDEGTFGGAGLGFRMNSRIGRPGDTKCTLELRIRHA